MFRKSSFLLIINLYIMAKNGQTEKAYETLEVFASLNIWGNHTITWRLHFVACQAITTFHCLKFYWDL